jgi:predicted regulator of Ras-like GTPase activity (Roadblock/LC7/MglB family)
VTAAGTIDGRQLDWLLVDFVRSTAGARHALVVSADGLRLAASQKIVEMAGGYLFVTSISQGSMLAVLAERTCDMGMIGYEMTLLAARVGHMLNPGRRTHPAGPPDRARP